MDQARKEDNGMGIYQTLPLLRAEEMTMDNIAELQELALLVRRTLERVVSRERIVNRIIGCEFPDPPAEKRAA